MEISEERYEFTSKKKTSLFALIAIGLVLIIASAIFFKPSSGHDNHDSHGGHAKVEKHDKHHGEEPYATEHNSHEVTHHGEKTEDKHTNEHKSEHHEAGHGEDAHGGEHGADSWFKHFSVNFWINNVFFGGLALVGVFFFALQYAAQAGWSAGIKRIPLAFGSWIPFALIGMLIAFFAGGEYIFHWTHTDLYHEGTAHFDEIINGKKGFFYWPLHKHPSFPIFWVGRLVVFFTVWYLAFRKLRSLANQEDLESGTKKWYQMRTTAAIFMVFFAFSSSVAAWDWVMSIDTHWFSTMFGWYVFASWWVACLALILFITVMLKDKGYLKIVNQNHLHDLGKFVFAFSIFWTYVWFSQFLLIYYANIPEETIYFVQRIKDDHFAPVFFINLILNFFLPFLLLMTRDSKRQSRMLKVVCPIVILGHWIDFYLMMTPGTLGHSAGFGALELGMILLFLGSFLFVVYRALSRMPLFGKNDPMLQESLHHHI